MISKQLRCLYLHGFKSGIASTKAQQSLDFFRQYQAESQIVIPQLPPEPGAAIELAMVEYNRLLDEVGPEQVVIIGSSLGGYYATYLMSQVISKAVLINPAIRPYELLKDYLGENENFYTGEKFIVTKDYIEALRRLEVTFAKPSKHFLLLLQTHDETLDYRLAVKKFIASPAIIEYGGDHSYQNFNLRLPTILNFAQHQLNM